MEQPTVSLLDGIATMRTIRRYTDEGVSEEDLNSILFAASRAPSGSNSQLFRFLVLRDGERARQARRLLGESFRKEWGEKLNHDGYVAGSGTDKDSRKGRLMAAMQHFVDHAENVPVVVFACLTRFVDPNPYIGNSVYPACQNLLLAARGLGYGGAMTMWHLPIQDQLREVLEIPTDVMLAACITLGRPAGSHGPVRRLPLDKLVFEDVWGSPAPWAHDPEGTTNTQAGPHG